LEVDDNNGVVAIYINHTKANDNEVTSRVVTFGWPVDM
jgi:hypothetical protein